MRSLDDFAEVVLCDFEFHHGGLPDSPPLIPLCACAVELRSGREYRLWDEELRRAEPPWRHDSGTIFVAYSTPAELSCFVELGWPLPAYILDLLIEFRLAVNGIWDKTRKRDILAALQAYGLSGIGQIEKTEWRKLILTAGPFDAEQRLGILDYCWTDIAALQVLLPVMLPSITNLDQALYRGRYAIPVTLTARTGIPIDARTWERIWEHREGIQLKTVKGHPLYDQTTFKLDRFGSWLAELGLLSIWPRTEHNYLATDDKTFKHFSRIPEIASLREIRRLLDQLDKPSFHVCRGRNYYTILPFQAITSRNATKQCIFQSPRWLRHLIQPQPGKALAYLDYAQEEFFLGSVLANDPAVIQLYQSGQDPYVVFGIMIDLIPPGRTESTHPAERAIAKTLALATQYGQTARGLAARLGISVNRATDLLTDHRRIFRRLWAWSDEQLCAAKWSGVMETVYGWNLWVTPDTGALTMRNWPIQSCGAEVLRLAHHYLTEAGFRICCMVHDSFLLECSETDLEDVTAEASRLMVRASERVLGGYQLRVDAHLMRYPDRFVEDRGRPTWEYVLRTTKSLESTGAGAL